MQHLSIQFMPASGNHEFMYNYGDIDVVVVSSKSVKPSHPHVIAIYNEQFMLMADASSPDLADEGSPIKCSGRSMKALLSSKMIWSPGKYFLLVRNRKTEQTVRFDLTLDDYCGFQMVGRRECSKLSVEAVLAGELYFGCNFAWRELTLRPGVRQLRAWAITRAQQHLVNNMLTKEPDAGWLLLNNNLLVVKHGDDYNGLKVKLLKSATGLEGTLKEVNCDNLDDVNTHAANSCEKLAELFERPHDNQWDEKTSKKIIYFFYNIGVLTGSNGKIILKKLMTLWPSNDVSAIFYGTQGEIDAMLEQNPSMKEHFPPCNRLMVEASTLEELIGLFCRELRLAHLHLSPAATEKLCRLIAEAHRQSITTCWDDKIICRYVRDTLLPIYLNRVIEHADASQKDNLLEVLPDDIDEAFFTSTVAATDQLLDCLNGIVGLEDIKRNIVTLSNRMRFYQSRRQLGLNTCDETTFHAVFMGNPGTGKTTVAKMLGQIYHSLGILSRGNVISVDRAQMVGEYIGQTEQIMKQILTEARGNVLFVDEAYTLYVKDSEKDFGRIAVECLLDVLSRKNPDMLIIFAGYEQEMKRLLKMNPGLDGRFPYKFYFPDCTAEQLMQIARSILDKDQYMLTAEAEALLDQSIRETVENKERTFSNARWVGQYIRNGIIPAMADRLSQSVHVYDRTVYQLIEAIDVKIGYSRLNVSNKVQTHRNAVGFRA